jgi:hypothetical protein
VIRRSSIAIAVVVLIACGFLLWYRHVLNKRAQVILRAAFELSEKQAPTLSDIQKHFGQELRVEECRASDCAYRVAVSNRVLAVLHLAPYTEMESHFWVRNGVVLMNMLNYTTTVNRRNTVVSHVQIDFCGDCQSFSIHSWDAASPLDTNGIVEIGSAVSAQSRRTVLSLNTDCLTKLNGCQSVADLLPAVWRQTVDSKIACVIQNDRGFVEKPAK